MNYTLVEWRDDVPVTTHHVETRKYQIYPNIVTHEER